MVGLWADFEQPTDIRYQTDNPKRELFSLLRERLAPVLNRRYELKQDGVPAKHRAALERLQSLRGVTLMTVPEMVVLNVQGVDGEDYYYTVLHNKAHSNITSLFSESKNREPEEDTLTVVRGFLGSYPDAYWRVEEAELTALVDAVSALTDEASYTALMEHYGIRRTSIEFWPHSDKVIAAHRAADPIANGLFDYNRLENR